MERGGKGRYGERLKAMIENDHTLNVTLFMLILPRPQISPRYLFC